MYAYIRLFYYYYCYYCVYIIAIILLLRALRDWFAEDILLYIYSRGAGGGVKETPPANCCAGMGSKTRFSVMTRVCYVSGAVKKLI